jgi:aspartate ammonia-lyase
MEYRREKDSMGEVKIPKEAPYGVTTARSLANFPISGLTLHPEQTAALGAIKLACAKANMELGLLSKTKGEAIVRACRELIDGRLHPAIMVDIFASGSGTSHNMNVNEVLANRAVELLGGSVGDRSVIHPNDDVNMGQSTNNVFPTSIRVASVPMVKAVMAAANQLAKLLRKKAKKFDNVLKSGRTHLQDAVPIRMGQVFGAFAYAVEKDLERLASVLPRLSEVGVGGNAVGTGINTDPRFRKLIVKHLNAETKQKFMVTGDGIEATHTTVDLAAVSAAVQLLAQNIQRICNDLRLMSSGPMTGLNEINLPPVEPGSSIMPGKVNPSICEAVGMVCLKVMGNHQTVTLATSSGQLELNVTMPVTGYALIESLKIMRNGIDVLTNKCIDGITVNKERCEWYAMQSPSLGTFLNPLIGYDKSSTLVKRAVAEGKTIPQIVRDEGLLTEKEIAAVFDPKKLTSPQPLPKK